MSDASLVPTQPPVPRRQDERSCRLVKWEPWPFENPSLIGHATVSFSGWVVHKVPVFRKADGSISVGAPDAADVDGDGRIKLKPDGKKSYWKVITFENNDARDRWRRMVLRALADAGIGPEMPVERGQ